MLFNSFVFIFAFLPITLVLFFVLGRSGRRQEAIWFLIAASIFFYGWWNPAYVALILISILFNYGISARLNTEQEGAGGPKVRKHTLIFGIAVNLALLGYFKYANFLTDTLYDVTSIDFRIEAVILPLAISFFTFQQITFLVDSYKGQTQRYKFSHYCLFVTFFPQLIAGPIVHHSEMLPQFMRKDAFSVRYENIAVGLTAFAIGLFKKVVIADHLAEFASPVFVMAGNGGDVSFLAAWQAALAYTFQLYFDFSGYCDMAIGLARLFGVRLPVNFWSPYKATSIIDFWRRWHITLSRFLRDYLYVPLGGNRRGNQRRYVNLMITMLLGGLWHGAGWTFVAWGGLHGTYLCINHIWRQIAPACPNHWVPKTFARLLSLLITFLAVVVAWVLFRAADMSSAMIILDAMFLGNGIELPQRYAHRLGELVPLLSDMGIGFGHSPLFKGTAVAWIVISAILCWTLPNTYEFLGRYRPVIKRPKTGGSLFPSIPLVWRPTYLFATLTSLFAAVAILSLTNPSEFLYFDF